ncbi:MAG: 1-acyl-sn-glycerol-3-phosphate acyltransferase [Bacteroidales bacterium]|nr:1-acyl-sn-glycerol-3-phosphate acyltransferase [Bacteroidales bacterium]
MGKVTIDKWSLKYTLLRSLYASVAYKSYFRKIYVHNVKSIPKNKPVILAPNHQNALMDPMAIVCTCHRQVIFIARADIFKNPIIARILNALKIVPMYRMRDGVENLNKNEEIFDLTQQILKNSRSPIAIFPEGNHGDKRRLRPLVKGIFRMAFRAQEEYGDQPGVLLQPVGIDYGHYQNFGSSLFIYYGEPFDISSYYLQYKENAPVAINQLRDRLSEEMKKYMIHIETEEYYDLYMDLRQIYNDSMRKTLNIKGKTLLDKFRADKKMIDILDDVENKKPGILKELNTTMKTYQKGLKTKNLRDWVLKKKKYSLPVLILQFIGMMALSPLYILGLINNYIPYKIPTIPINKIKDPQFHSTMKYGIGLVTFLLYYIILIVLALIFLPFIWLKVIYIILIPFTGHFSFRYFIAYKKLFAKFRYTFQVLFKNLEVSNLRELRKEIFDRMDTFVNTATL